MRYSRQFLCFERFIGEYFHKDCYANGDTNDEIVEAYIRSNWPYQRLGLRADIERFLHENANDALDALNREFYLGAYPQPDNLSMANWLRAVASRLRESDSDK